MSARFEPIIGRYMHLDLFGRPHRIYVEEAGEGTPLLCLHTAGSDGRQYRGLMNDARVTETPRHRLRHALARQILAAGRLARTRNTSSPRRNTRTMILEISAALELDKPIVIGCSIGGRIALHLALEHPERFRAIIGLQAGAHVDPYYDSNFLHRPDVHGGEVCGRHRLRAGRPRRARRRALGNAVALHAGRPRRLQGRSLFLQARRRHPRPRRADRHAALPAVSAVRRIRLFLHAGGDARRSRTAFQAARPPS